MLIKKKWGGQWLKISQRRYFWRDRPSQIIGTQPPKNSRLAGKMCEREHMPAVTKWCQRSLKAWNIQFSESSQCGDLSRNTPAHFVVAYGPGRTDPLGNLRGVHMTYLTRTGFGSIQYFELCQRRDLSRHGPFKLVGLKKPTTVPHPLSTACWEAFQSSFIKIKCCNAALTPKYCNSHSMKNKWSRTGFPASPEQRFVQELILRLISTSSPCSDSSAVVRWPEPTVADKCVRAAEISSRDMVRAKLASLSTTGVPVCALAFFSIIIVRASC